MFAAPRPARPSAGTRVGLRRARMGRTRAALAAALAFALGIGTAHAQAPVADAGDDLEVDPGTRVTLDGSRSSDPDGAPLTFAWGENASEPVTLSGTTKARLSFTAPETPGALTFRLTVTDPAELSDSDRVTATVRNLVVSFEDATIGPLALTLGETIEPVRLPEASGGNGTLLYSLTSEPAGLAGLDFDPESRWLTGTPTEAGSFTFTWHATDEDGHTAAVVFLVTVRDLVVSFGDATTGPLALTLGETIEPVRLPEASGGNGTLLYSLTSEPAGLAGLDFDPESRWLTGTPTEAGSFTFTWRATDEDGRTAAVVFLVTVRDLVVSFGDATTGPLALTLGETMTRVRLPEASGGNGTLLYSLTSEPAGLAGLDFNPGSRWLTGTPTEAGNFTFTWRATDEDGRTAELVFLVTVNRAPVAYAGDDLTVNPGAPVRLDGSGSVDPDGDILTFAWTQTQGTQVTLSDAGYVQPSFTAPWQPGPLVFRLTVTNPGGLSASDEVTVTVGDLVPTFGDVEVALLVLDVGQEMEAVVLPEARGGNGTLSYGLGSFPLGLAGLDFDPASRRLSGTPATKGEYVFVYSSPPGGAGPTYS